MKPSLSRDHNRRDLGGFSRANMSTVPPSKRSVTLCTIRLRRRHRGVVVTAGLCRTPFRASPTGHGSGGTRRGASARPRRRRNGSQEHMTILDINVSTKFIDESWSRSRSSVVTPAIAVMISTSCPIASRGRSFTWAPSPCRPMQIMRPRSGRMPSERSTSWSSQTVRVGAGLVSSTLAANGLDLDEVTAVDPYALRRRQLFPRGHQARRGCHNTNPRGEE